MKKGLKELAKSLYEKARALTDFQGRRAEEVAINIISELAKTTPVDTSKAISNWQIGLDMAGTGAIPAYSPGKLGSTAEASRSATIAEAKLVLLKRKPGQSIFIYNNAHYIRRLNEGHSSQQPIPGFIERAYKAGAKKSTAVKLRF